MKGSVFLTLKLNNVGFKTFYLLCIRQTCLRQAWTDHTFFLQWSLFSVWANLVDVIWHKNKSEEVRQYKNTKLIMNACCVCAFMINFVFLSQLSHFYALTLKHSTPIYSQVWRRKRLNRLSVKLGTTTAHFLPKKKTPPNPLKVARNEVENASFAQPSAHRDSRIWRPELIEPAAERKRRARGRRPTFQSACPDPQILPQCNISSNYPL